MIAEMKCKDFVLYWGTEGPAFLTCYVPLCYVGTLGLKCLGVRRMKE